MLQELQFSVCALGQDGSAERLHNLLYSDILIRKLIPSRAAKGGSSVLVVIGIGCCRERRRYAPDKAKGSHPNRLEIRVSGARVNIRRQIESLSPIGQRTSR